MDLSKLRLLVSVLATNPPEFADRLRAALDVNRDRLFESLPAYPAMPWNQLVENASRILRADLAAIEREIDERQLESAVAGGVSQLRAAAPFTTNHNADSQLARLCYMMCRARRPRTVVETGVAYGVTTSFVLTALEANGSGHLYSIDLPPLGRDADDSVGRLVPERLRPRWTLLRGTSRRLLPPLLARLGHVDLFIHDSLHTRRNMTSEFEAVHACRSDPFVLIADDIEGNGAFQEYVDRHRRDLALHAVWAASAKTSRGGICISAPGR